MNVGQLGALPGQWETPPHLRLDPPIPGSSLDPSSPQSPSSSPYSSSPASSPAGSPEGSGDGGGHSGPLTRRLGLLGRRTTSSAGDDRSDRSTGDERPRRPADAKEAAKVAAGLVGLLVLLAGWAVAGLRPGKTVRAPSDAETDDIAVPLGRIAARHLPAEILTGDVADGITAATATAAYLRNGDLIVPKPTAQTPSGVNESEEYVP